MIFCRVLRLFCETLLLSRTDMIISEGPPVARKGFAVDKRVLTASIEQRQQHTTTTRTCLRPQIRAC